MRDKINVLFLHSQDGFGADSAIHGHLMRYLDRDRFSVHLACSNGAGSGTPAAFAKFREIPELHIRPTQFAPGFRHRGRDALLLQLRAASSFPMHFVGLVEYVKRERIHVIHGTDRPRDAFYTVALGKMTGAKSVVHVHVAWAVGYSAPARWGVRNADAVFAISRFVAATVIATGSRRERIHTIPNSVDSARWDPATDGSGIRREFAIPEDAPLLASVSRLFGQKGQRELLQAVSSSARMRWRFTGARSPPS
jgi:glycosyltransferase involved in cell wall biosynthesis